MAAPPSSTSIDMPRCRPNNGALSSSSPRRSRRFHHRNTESAVEVLGAVSTWPRLRRLVLPVGSRLNGAHERRQSKVLVTRQVTLEFTPSRPAWVRPGPVEP